MRQIFILFSLFIISISCSDDENSPEIQETINSQDILINIEPGELIAEKTISVSLTTDVGIDVVHFYVDNEQVSEFLTPPYEYILSGSDLEDGEHSFKAEVIDVNGNSQQNTVLFLTDNSGPEIQMFDLNPDDIICDLTSFSPIIQDDVSEVVSVKFYINNEFISEASNTNEPTFTIDPQLYTNGDTELKLVMEDALGNVSEDLIFVSLGSTLVALNIPNEFVRPNTGKFVVMLSNADGEFIDMQMYNEDHLQESISFCASFSDNDTEYILTFFDIFDDTVYKVHSYYNLKSNFVGDQIVFNPRPGSISGQSVNLGLENISANSLKAVGLGYSLVTSNNALSGFRYTSSLNDIYTPNTFIRGDFPGGPQWAFIQDIENVSELLPSDFSNQNVMTNTVNMDYNGVDNPFLKIYGFENESLFSVMSQHEVYFGGLSSLTLGDYNYTFPDIFYKYFYSLKVNDFYYQEGLGLPPSSVNIPNQAINFSLNANVVNYQGLPNFEVGKISLFNAPSTGQITPENPDVRLTMIFNGNSDVLSIPQIPSGIIPDNVRSLFNNANFSPIQAVAENYDSFLSYEEYIQNTLINTMPFYKNSASRERVFTSNVGASILPIDEFPFYTRF